MNDSFGQKLRTVRRTKGISQRELAAAVGVDFSYISKVENDRIPSPSADTIEKICIFMGIPSEELLALTGKVPSDVREMLGTSMAAQQFMKQARTLNLTEDEWRHLTRQIKGFRRG